MAQVNEHAALATRPSSAASSLRVAARPPVPGGEVLPAPRRLVTPYQAVLTKQQGEQRPMSAAEQRMEERWLEKRNREVINRTIAEEQRSAMRNWAERRARVEEEIARNVEISRHQSQLGQRGYAAPPDCDEDIAMTATLNAPIE